MKKTDLLIVGAGALGAFHALHALNRGLSVQLLEKDPAPQHATVRNFGQVVPSGMNTKWQTFGRRSLTIYKELQADTDISLQQNGSFYIASNQEEQTLIEELHSINRSNDYPSELLNSRQCMDRLPGLQSSYCTGGLFFPEEVTVEANTMIHRVIDYLVQTKNLQYKPSTPIRELENTGNGVVATDASGIRHAAAKAIVCSGSEFQLLFPDLFAKSDLVGVKIQMLRTRRQPALRIPGNILTGLSIRRYESFHECPSWNLVKSKEDEDVPWKKWGVHILFKQSPDGSVIIGDSHSYADAVHINELGFELDEAINRYMIKEAQRIFNLEDWGLQSTWFGVYSQCKNRDIFQHTVDDDIHIVTGIGGKGMTGSAGFAEHHLSNLLD